MKSYSGYSLKIKNPVVCSLQWRALHLPKRCYGGFVLLLGATFLLFTHLAQPVKSKAGLLMESKIFTYAIQPATSNLVAQANSMGAQGFAFYALSTEGNLYVKDSSYSGTYSYDLRPSTSSSSTTLAQMNAQGEQGFAFYMPLSTGNLYVKDSSHGGTYSYSIVSAVASASGTEAQMNAQGAQGYAFYIPLSFGNLYVKDSSHTGTYSYRLVQTSTLAQMNAQGAQGFALLARFAFVSQLAFGTDIRSIYVKDSKESNTYSFAFLPDPSSTTARLAQLNTQGAQGFLYLLSLFSTTGLQNIYMKSGTGQSCSYAITPTSQNFDAVGGNGTVNVTAPSGCAWTATSNNSWITINSGSSGSGNGTVSYTIASNSGSSSRTGTLTIAGYTFTVTQAGGNSCVAPSIINHPNSMTITSGGTATLSVSASGTTPLTYQWYRGVSSDISNPISGGTNSSFTTPQLTSTTNYWVRVSNACNGGSRVDSNTATVTVTAPLKVEVFDPACNPNSRGSGEACSGAYVVIGPRGASLSSDPNHLAKASVKRDGAATDGVTLLLLRVQSETPVTFSLKTDNGALAGAEWGTLRSASAPAGNSVTVTPDITTALGKVAFAVYQAPIDFPGDALQRSTSITLEVTSSSGNGSRTLTLRRPPLVLVHGVWSNGEAWQGLERYLVERGFDVCAGCRLDYGNAQNKKYIAGSFDPAKFATPDDRFVIEQLIKATDLALKSYRVPRGQPLGVAVSQVDVIGHSMGGLVARARVSYKRPNSPYKRKDNYDQGDFHKIITVGTPHFGTPIADFLLANKCQPTLYGLEGTKQIRIRLHEWFAAFGKPLGPAIYGFQQASAAIKNIGTTKVPSHAVIGVEPGELGSTTEKTLNLLIRPLSNFGRSVDDILLGELKHDTIVPLQSQQGGLKNSATSSAANVVHADLTKRLSKQVLGCNTCIDDVGETSSEDVWLRVLRALQAPTKSNTFDYFPAFKPHGAEIKNSPCNNFADNVSDSVSLPGVAVPNADLSITLSPSTGTTVQTGDVVPITLTITGGNATSGALFSIGGGFYRVDGPGPYSFSYKVDATQIGKLEIAALTYGAGPDNYFANSTISIPLISQPLSLSVTPPELPLNHIGEQFQIQVTGLLADQTPIDLTSGEMGTMYSLQSGTNTVISVSPEGLVEARGEGQDTILISNSGKRTTVSVAVNLDNPVPAISSLTPNSVMAGGADFNLTINGTNFNNDSIAYWNGEPRPTTFVSATQLMVAISAADIAAPGNVDVVAFTPNPGGGGATMAIAVIGQTTTVSAASYSGGTLAAESIVSAFGQALATAIESATLIPLPTSLAGTTVKVKDSAGVERMAPLFYVSPTQVNYLIPPGTANGAALVIISNDDGAISSGMVQIEKVSPGLFSADSTGKGLATGYITRVKADQTQVAEPIVIYDTEQKKLVPVPVDVSHPNEQVFLVIYGTGIRFNSSLAGVTVKVGGKEAPVSYAREQGFYVGLDQVNLRLLPDLAGKSEVDIQLIVDGKPANPVKVYLK